MKRRVSLWVVFAVMVLHLGSIPLLPASASDEPVLVVTSAADAGPGTLREALMRATPGTTITFDPIVFPVDQPATIAVRSALPVLEQGRVTIDASATGVILDGGHFGGEIGLHITSSLNVIKGLWILHFRYHGIALDYDASDNIIGGQNATPDSGCSGDCNVISANGHDGLQIIGPGAHDNRIVGNFIGTDPTGKEGVGNAGRGVTIGEGATRNHIGGTSPAERNVISGNGDDGVAISDRGTTQNTVSGNYIGTDLSGRAVIPNGNFGVNLALQATENVVGGRTAAERNVISGNLHGGVNIASPGVMHNIVIGNYIGTDASGTFALPNLGHGVTFGDSAQHNRVGGPTPGERNVISGNRRNGVTIETLGTQHNTVLGNYVGTDHSGTAALDNENGVYVGAGAADNLVGGGMGEGNVISGNRQHGVLMVGEGTTGNICGANLIGTTSDGTDPLGNAGHGVYVAQGAHDNMIGPDNTIAYNGRDGVHVQGSDARAIRVTMNSVYDNHGKGIVNAEGGNLELSAPVIDHIEGRLMRGQAPANATVEIFSDAGEQGRLLEGGTTADDQGRFTFLRPSGRFSGPQLTAVALDPAGNTSSFSAAASPPAPRVMRELPAIVGPAQVSVEPAVVGTNVALALFCVLFFGLTSTVFNAILAEYRDELLGPLSRLVPRSLAGALNSLGSSLRGLAGQGRVQLLLTWVLVLLVTALLESLLDAEVPIVGRERLGLWITLFASALVVSALELGADWYARRRLAPSVEAQSRIQWLGIPIALGCVVLSRALDFRPGYLFGIVGALYLMPDLPGAARAGRRALAVLLTLFVAGVTLWIATSWLPPSLADLEALFLTIFLLTLQGVFFALLPLALTDGGDIWSWRKGLWLVFFSLVLFLFHHIVLNPDGSDVQALQQNGVQTLLLLIGVFGLATLLLWLLFPFRLQRQRAGGA
jgi:hypothetical protein